MPIIGLKNELQNKELQIIPAKGFPIESNWNTICLKDKNLLAVATSYLEFINQKKIELSKKNLDGMRGIRF